MIEAGTRAPDFTLHDQDGNEVSLRDLEGQRTVLVFYPGDFSLVCTDQLNVYQEVLPDFDRRGVKLYGVSVDSAFCHKAFRDQLGVSFPLLADFHPKGEVAKAFGAWSETYGVAKRALVVIGPDLVVEWSYMSPPLEVPGADLIFDALESAPAA